MDTPKITQEEVAMLDWYGHLALERAKKLLNEWLWWGCQRIAKETRNAAPVDQNTLRSSHNAWVDKENMIGYAGILSTNGKGDLAKYAKYWNTGEKIERHLVTFKTAPGLYRWALRHGIKNVKPNGALWVWGDKSPSKKFYGYFDRAYDRCKPQIQAKLATLQNRL